MLTSSYIHIRGITPAAERSLWDQGALTWNAFLNDPKRWVTNGFDVARLERAVRNSLQKLEEGEHQYFARRLPKREFWRAFPEFRDSLVYLDIETDGRIRGDAVTLVGLYDGSEYRAFLKGDNLAQFADAISEYSAVVTFFGNAFDMPVLARAFPMALLDQVHIDLCPVMRRLGYRGGLKRIERLFGITRSPETQGLSGRDAITLWRRHCRGDDRALDVLLQYNREDVVNLERLMEFAYLEMRERTMLEGSGDTW